MSTFASEECAILACQQNSAGEFEMTLADGRKQTALLLDTNVEGDIAGMIATISVKQSFKNDTDDWVSGRYVFPLPENAAVDSLQIIVGERVIKGVVQEKKQAQKTFQQAKKAGKKAGLLEQHRPNLFSIAVANIAPRESIVAHITYVDTVRFENEKFSLRFPTTLTPRYIPGLPLAKQAHDQDHPAFEDNKQLPSDQKVLVSAATGWAVNTTSVPDAANITPPQKHATPGQTTHVFSFQLSLDAGLPLAAVTSNTHPITSNFNGSGSVEVALANGTELMNSDLRLEWQPNVGQVPQAAVFKQAFEIEGREDHYTMLMVTPPAAGVSVALPRDVTFIIDSSGSMAGLSMQQAKDSLHQAMQYLSSNDRFNVVDFDSTYRPLFPQSQPANAQNIQFAQQMIAQLNADGGTEMLGALDFALNQAVDEQYLRQIIFITDGSIGNEHELFSLINRKLGSARLFTIGIGHAPNSYFMRKAAKFGRGTYTYVANLNEVRSRMADLFLKLNQPRLRNIKVDWPHAVEQYPKHIPDLYAGEPIVLIGKSDSSISAVKVSGDLANQPWQQSVQLGKDTPKSAPANAENLDTLWARRKIESLIDQLVANPTEKPGIKQTITELGIAHQLVTRFTSFVAVEEVISRPEGTKDKHDSVPNLMPKGSTMPAPQTATTATLQTLLGSLMILLAGLLRRLGRARALRRGASNVSA
ncbi:MAG: marine proteobacterial sortase target protein [Pseudomonadota bacterium]